MPIFLLFPRSANQSPEALKPLVRGLVCTLCSALVATAAHAQAIPDPALILQEQLRRIDNGASSLPAPPKANLQPAPRAQLPDVGTTVDIREIQFSRSVLLSDKELRTLAAKYVGRSLTTADLQQLLDAIAELYQSKGVLTAVGVLPQQDLKTGLLRVVLVEGRFGDIAVKVEPPGSPDWVKKWFSLPADEVIDSEQLRRQLALFNLTSDFNAQAQFVPGASFGISDLAVEVTDSARLQTWAMLDSYSGQAKASQSLSLGLRWAPVSARGGRLDLALLGTANAHTVSGAFSMPVGVTGWRAGLNAAASRSNFRVPSTTSAPDLALQGSSESLGAELERTWVLTAPWVIIGSASAGSLKSTTELLGVTLAQNQLDKLALSARVRFETAARKVNLRTSLVTARSNGLAHSYLDTSGQWRQTIDARGQWQWRVAGQLRTNDRGQPGSADAFALGGPESLRGFNSNTLSGSSGYALQLELRRQLLGEGNGRTEGFIFRDEGRAKGSGHQQAESMGFGIQTQVTGNVGVDAVFSRQTQGLQGQKNRLNLRLVASW
jgi:hemolysin activation/secretion protein